MLKVANFNAFPLAWPQLAIMCIMEQTKSELEHTHMKWNGLLNKLPIIFSFLNRRLLFWIIPTPFKPWLWVNVHTHFSLLSDNSGWGERTRCFHKRRMRDTYLLSVYLLFMAKKGQCNQLCCSLTKTVNHSNPSRRVSLKTEKVCALSHLLRINVSKSWRASVAMFPMWRR